MSLANELGAFKAEFLSKVDGRVASVMENASADLEKEFHKRPLLGVGDHAPNFTLPSATNKSVSLSKKLEEGPVIISFYRGSWCPYCNLELRAYQEILPEIKASGGSLIAILPQTPDSSLSTMEKNALEFDVLSDVGSNVAESYRVAFRLPQELQVLYKELGGSLPEYNGTDDWVLPVSATFVINREGRIVLASIDPDYQNRLEPAEALAAIRNLTN
ncbi:peroxiredoxin-like family protein [Microbulbifer sp. ZKSA006]|uniref:peroxiredoxin-like family protein n=1 Tax=Microbulbifer sp. ZKSA006 TaxID=3243390 RepID=UPI0040391745